MRMRWQRPCRATRGFWEFEADREFPGSPHTSTAVRNQNSYSYVDFAPMLRVVSLAQVSINPARKDTVTSREIAIAALTFP
jgi:hypothetical protein